ncbi:MAG: hypothetical protein CVV51_03925 [Spirochaetae bacterium HGW-Spirochaetae-7]|jgi:hypothetical protein|nr:MAG: hypothetical protein CVV51_03925 [Spirochaetae bacterium HGW-Spirochaetae-7]
MRIIRPLLVALHLFVGIGAIVGGIAAIMDPVSPLGMPASALTGTPFDSFIIPGVILFCVIGLGNLAAAVTAFLGKWWMGYPSGTAAIALMIWIVIQCVMLDAVAGLHVIFFTIGAVQGCLALAMTMIEGVWPGTWVTLILARLRRNAG